MTDIKLPQLRILATSYCNNHCIYCRPSGEASTLFHTKKEIEKDKALQVCRIYKKYGGNEIKISGGDPIFWSDLPSFIEICKKQIGISKVEVITRSPKIVQIVDSLKNAGTDVLNFSLDAIDNDIYQKVTGKNNFKLFIEAIIYCSSLLPVKINTVVMRNINDNQIDSIIDFCESNQIKELKLLDIIEDLNDYKENISSQNEEKDSKLRNLYISLKPIVDHLRNLSLNEQIVYQGGLGHPMNEFLLKSGLRIIVKNSDNGAWYGDICKTCSFFPCHDALMALRLTPDCSLQFCLLNKDTNISLLNLTESEIDDVIRQALNVYHNAYFIDNIHKLL